MSPAPPTKRRFSHFHQPLLPTKKPKPESSPNSFAPCLISISTLENWPMLIATPVPGNDIKESSFDPLFDDTALDIFPLHETSDVSSDESRLDNRHYQQQLPTSPLSTAGEGQQKHTSSSKTVSAQKDPDFHKKRQADRAARNRESSRRAREKQKNRFRALETGFVALQEAVQSYKLQNEHLQSLLDRAHVVQQSCPVCSYNSSLSQRPGQQDSHHKPRHD